MWYSKKTKHGYLRYGMFAPLALMFASLVSCFYSYTEAKQDITGDLNDAIISLANENSELWTRQDTIAALRQMHETTHKPLIYQASDIDFRNNSLKNEAYFTIALVDKNNSAPKIQGNKIASDSIIIVPEKTTEGISIYVQGFADCSVASVFAASDKTLPGIFLSLSLLSMMCMFIWRRSGAYNMEPTSASMPATDTIESIKLTPMQRKLTQMLLDAPDKKVDKTTLCVALWGNKDNAEESLYTLIRRTKSALASTGIEIICNRGESYEIRLNS